MGDVVKELLRRTHKQRGPGDDLAPQYARAVKGDKTTQIQPCVVPKHWYLGSLPPERLVPSTIVRFSNFVAAQNVIIEPGRPIQIEQSETFVAFLYHFFATTPIVGGRTELLQPHELLGHLNLKLKAKGVKSMPYIDESSVNTAFFTGMPFVTSDPINDIARIPLFFHGPMTLKPSYDVVVDLGFDVQRIGFVLDGFRTSTADLQRTIERCSVLDR